MVVPRQVEVQGRLFSADALPDVFDERDLEYWPRLGDDGICRRFHLIRTAGSAARRDRASRCWAGDRSNYLPSLR